MGSEHLGTIWQGRFGGWLCEDNSQLYLMIRSMGHKTWRPATEKQVFVVTWPSEKHSKMTTYKSLAQGPRKVCAQFPGPGDQQARNLILMDEASLSSHMDSQGFSVICLIFL